MKKTWEVILFIIKCTFIGFGGGNALMPIIKKEAVDKRKWLTLKDFDKLVVTTNLIPGPSVVETLSYIAMKQLGKLRGALVSLLAIIPHLLFALILLFIADKYLPIEYLVVISVSVMPVIIGILIAFGYRYIKQSNQLLKLPLWFAIFIVTIIFSLFIPAPYNIPAIIMIIVILIVLITSVIKTKKVDK